MGITRKTPQKYWTVQPSWYQGDFKTAVDAYGQARDYDYYLKKEAEYDGVAACLNSIPLIGSGLVSIWQNYCQWVYNGAYQNNYMQACQECITVVTQLDSIISMFQTDLNTMINQAKTDIQNNLITPIQNDLNTAKQDIANAEATISNILQPAIQQLQSDLAQAQSVANNALTSAQQAVSAVQDAVQQAQNALQNSTAAQTIANNVQTAMKNAQTQLNALVNQMNAAQTSINNMLSDLSTKTKEITDLLNRVQALENSSATPTQKIKDIFRQL